MSHDAGANPWGVLINPDKSPAPLLEQLCLGIAQIMTTFDEYATPDLTPHRLAAFYRKVGGNYDVLFLQTKPSALSFIYQRLGCFHSIQPSDDAFRPPSIPALQPIGFVRWQTIQLLLDPDEHAKYLQAAVALWDIRDANGDLLPKSIPRRAFPADCDADMMKWHQDVSRRFEVDFWKKNTLRSSPPDFNAYYSQFRPKDESNDQPPPPPPPQQRSRPFIRRNHSSTEAPQSSARHTRRRSAEYPPSNTPRRAHSTHFRRPDHPRSGYASPRAPSPPRWTSFSRPVSPSTHAHHTHHSSHHTIPIHNLPVHSDPSDASSEDSSPEPPRRRTEHHTHHRNLSPPHASHARRHSHEAYARKPHRDLSPNPPHTRPVNSREAAAAYVANQHRLYDSDSARHAPAHAPRHSTRNPPNLTAPSNRGIHFRDPVYADSAAAAAAAAASGSGGGGMAPRPSSHRYPPTYFVRTVHSDRDLDDARRNSYHYAPTNGGGGGGGGACSGSSGERGRYAVAPGATGTGAATRTSPRWAGMAATRGVPVPVPVPVMVDPEYAEYAEYARGRRATMYERWDRMEG